MIYITKIKVQLSVQIRERSRTKDPKILCVDNLNDFALCPWEVIHTIAVKWALIDGRLLFDYKFKYLDT